MKNIIITLIALSVLSCNEPEEVVPYIEQIQDSTYSETNESQLNHQSYVGLWIPYSLNSNQNLNITINEEGNLNIVNTYNNGVLSYNAFETNDTVYLNPENTPIHEYTNYLFLDGDCLVFGCNSVHCVDFIYKR